LAQTIGQLSSFDAKVAIWIVGQDVSLVWLRPRRRRGRS
jgi:hypothetical protein